LRPLVTSLDDSSEVGSAGGRKKSTSVIARFTQGIKRGKK